MMSSRKASLSAGGKNTCPAVSGHDKRVTPDVRAPSDSWALLFLACSQPLLIVAGDAFVALRQRNQFLAADDVVDVLERLVAGAAVDFLQDRVGRRLAVGEHHL